jgi:hypothetical protein
LNAKFSEECVAHERLNSTGTLIQQTTTEARQWTLCITSGLDVHKKTISYCVKDASGEVHQEGKTGATRAELDGWRKTLSTTMDSSHGGNDFHRLEAAIRLTLTTGKTGLWGLLEP